MFRKMSPCFSVVALVCFVAAMVGVWRLPLMLAGQVYDVPPLLLARNFMESGQFILTDDIGRVLAPHLLTDIGVITSWDGRLSAMLFSWLSQWIAWSDLMLWSVVAAVSIATSLVAWWLCIVKLFDRRIAWISTILIAFMPLYWRQAVWLDNYNLAFIFLFATFASYAYLYKRSLVAALLLSGAFFGACASAKDTFLIFVPWFCIGYTWVHRPHWRTALMGVAVFGFAALAVYIAPYIGDIRTLGYPANHNLAAFWPGAADLREGFYLHAYPDPYTYFFAREAYDEILLQQFAELSRLSQYQQYKSFINFGIGEIGVLGLLFNGLWLFAGSIPELFQQEHIGGAVMWLFIVPGFFVLRRDRGMLAFHIVGLIISAECVMRFFLHYGRNHLMDYGWALALLAAVGIVAIADMCARNTKRMSSLAIASFIVVFVVMQLVQANRVIFARWYDHPSVERVIAIADATNTLSPDAVVALGIGSTQVKQVAQMSHASIVLFAERTVTSLLDAKEFATAFDLYGVTHVYGYSENTIERMDLQAHSIEELDVDISQEQKVHSPFVRWLLHLIR